MISRVRQIDFLRAVAVILVLFRHHWVGIDVLQRIGWIGVDLFFVLSGFLVSGLLFSEYKRYGNIKAGQFLIRRGFKIYPLFYLSIFLTLIIFEIYILNSRKIKCTQSKHTLVVKRWLTIELYYIFIEKR